MSRRETRDIFAKLSIIMSDPSFKDGTDTSSVLACLGDIIRCVTDGSEQISVPCPIGVSRPVEYISVNDSVNIPLPSYKTGGISRRTLLYNLSKERDMDPATIQVHEEIPHLPRRESRVIEDAMSDISDQLSEMFSRVSTKEHYPNDLSHYSDSENSGEAKEDIIESITQDEIESPPETPVSQNNHEDEPHRAHGRRRRR